MTCALKNIKGLVPNDEKRRFHAMGINDPLGIFPSAKHAITLQVDYMIGDVFYPSVARKLLAQGIKYYPYIGDIVDTPMVLMNSTPQEIRTQMNAIEKSGCQGVTLMAYENLKHNPAKCMYEFFENEKLQCIVAGNVNDKYKIMAILGMGVFGFAIGSSFFHGDFEGLKNFKDQVMSILNLIEEQEGKRHDIAI